MLTSLPRAKLRRILIMADPNDVALRLMDIEKRCADCFYWWRISFSSADGGECKHNLVHFIHMSPHAGRTCSYFSLQSLPRAKGKS